jgi:hypothetical protein
VSEESQGDRGDLEQATHSSTPRMSTSTLRRMTAPSPSPTR